MFVFVKRLQESLPPGDDSVEHKRLRGVLVTLSCYVLAEGRRLYNVGLLEVEDSGNSDNDMDTSDFVPQSAEDPA